MGQTHEITQLLQKWSDGNSAALEKLIPLVYNELHRQAAHLMRKERLDHTLQTTALIHETYLKLIDQREVGWENRAHFFAVAAGMMRRILVDHARARTRGKRGGAAVKLTLNEDILTGQNDNTELLIALDEALGRLEQIDERQARIVELRYFSGLTMEETAAVLNISRSTVAEDWAMAKAWLHRELTR